MLHLGQFPVAMFQDMQFHSPLLTSKDLENASKVEPSALSESEELAEEQEQRQYAEDDGKDHQSLDTLQPFCKKRNTHTKSH